VGWGRGEEDGKKERTRKQDDVRPSEGGREKGERREREREGNIRLK
jgi:hypothetical protein